MNLPQDPIILLSYLNTQLRDNYPSFAEFCRTFDADETAIAAKLKSAGYVYDAERNQFVASKT